MAPLSEQGFRCVAFDRRGHGRSGDPGGGYDFDTLADDVEAVLASLEVSLSELAVEAFFPADQATALALQDAFKDAPK